MTEIDNKPASQDTKMAASILNVKTQINTILKEIHKDAFSLSNTGKLLRGLLVIEMGNVMGLQPNRIERIAAAVELIHLASLLHDDVVDNATLRRNAPTFWIQHGKTGAILTGDYAITQSLLLLVDNDNDHLLSGFIRFVSDLCKGELLQELADTDAPLTEDTYLKMAQLKTGSLFAFSASATAPIGTSLSAALTQSGLELGIVYQIIDDIYDKHGTEKYLGKTLGSDEQSGKVTALNTMGRDTSLLKIDELLDQASARLAQWPRVRNVWNDFVSEHINPSFFALKRQVTGKAIGHQSPTLSKSTSLKY